eukprot:snap_masked-scaffold_31-processed-gene-3.8-mRNA-1 protein AED:1.00 eAED:1.00 QI:0/-1/0/0/-1/1/1/0/61
MRDALRQNAYGNFSDVDMTLSQHSGSTILPPRKTNWKENVSKSQRRLNLNNEKLFFTYSAT